MSPFCVFRVATLVFETRSHLRVRAVAHALHWHAASGPRCVCTYVYGICVFVWPMWSFVASVCVKRVELLVFLELSLCFSLDLDVTRSLHSCFFFLANLR